MTENTINADKTIAVSGKDASVVCSLRRMYPFNLMFPIRDALRHELSWAHYWLLLGVPNPIACGWYMNFVQRAIAQSAYRNTIFGKTAAVAYELYSRIPQVSEGNAYLQQVVADKKEEDCAPRAHRTV